MDDEEIARKLSELDQQKAGVMELASATKLYYQTLVDEGMAEEAALTLACTWVAAVIGS